MDQEPVQRNTVDREQAIQIIKDASIWLQSTYGVNTETFYRDEVETQNMPNQVPILVDEWGMELRPGYQHYWLFSSGQRNFEPAPNKYNYPFEYFGGGEYDDPYEALIVRYNELQSQGYDVSFRGGGGAGSTEVDNSIRPSLFNFGVVDAIKIALHEPFHVLFDQFTDDRYFNEAITTYMGLQAMKAFAVKIKDENSDLADEVEKFVDIFELKYEMVGVGLSILEDEYFSGESRIRTEEENNIMRRINDLFRMGRRKVTDFPNDNRVDYDINNSNLAQLRMYTPFLKVSKACRKLEIGFQTFLQADFQKQRVIFIQIQEAYNKEVANELRSQKSVRIEENKKKFERIAQSLQELFK